jgi:anti-sigma factor RsiW
VRRELSKAEVERLFVEAVDDALPPAEQAAFAEQLAADVALQARFETYKKTVSRLRVAPKEKAPDALASMILRRTRRRRFQFRNRELADWRFPAEVVIPLLLAAAVAVFMLLASP